MNYKSTAINLDHPTVAASRPYGTSETYRHLDTTEVVDALTECGWGFEAGTARRTRNPDRLASVAHVLRFSHPLMPLVRGCRVEAVIVNSHDQSTAFRLAFGVFRIACANGLIVQSCNLGSIRMRHHGLTLDRVIDATNGLIRQAPQVAGIVSDWSDIQLDACQQQALTRRCAQARWDDAIWTGDLSAPRRDADKSDDLWTVFNRAQESVLRGGVSVTRYGPDNTTHTAKASPIRGALRQVALNEQLWGIAEEFATQA